MIGLCLHLAALVAITVGHPHGAVVPVGPQGRSGWIEQLIPPPKASSYFILTPRTVRPGMNLQLTVMIKEAPRDVTIRANVAGRVYRNNTWTYEEIASTTATLSSGEKDTMEVEIPDTLPEDMYSFYLRVNGTGGLSFSHEKYLYIRKKSASIFIQTDKSQYKPGQTVKMRVFAVDPNLKPYHGDINITIKDSARNIIKQWNNQRSSSGVIKKELALSDQPVMGSWVIEATAKGETERKNFEVKEYVLPRAEVEVDVDSYIDAQQKFVNGTIRAKYTYGKPLEGLVDITIQRSYNNDGTSTKIMTQLVDGKADFSVSSDTLKELFERPKHLRPDMEWEPNLQWQRFTINSVVTDKLTDISYEDKKQFTFRPSIYSISLIYVPNNYKLGSDYYAMVQVKNINGDGLTDNDLYTDGKPEPLRVIAKYRGCYDYQGEYWHIRAKNFTLQADGFRRFQVDIIQGCEGFQLEIWFRNENTQSSYVSEYRTRYTGSGLTLSFDDLTEQIMPGDDVAVNVKFADRPKEYTYYIISKGAVVHWRTLPATQKRFTFRATTRMAPSARIVAWYTTERNEIISESLSLTLGDLFENKVSLSFSTNQTEPARQLSLDVSAAPRSYVALLAVDKSVLLMQDTNDITKEAVENEIRQYETVSPIPYYRHFWWPIPIGGGDPMSVFRNADVLVMTDGYIYEHSTTPTWEAKAQSGVASSKDSGAFAPSAEGARGAPGRDASVGRVPSLQEPERVRTVFPETWIWADEVSNADGKVTLQLTAPDTITTWVASAFALNDEKGLGVAANRARTTVFKPFFASLNLPYSVIRYEEFALQVLIYNYMEEEQKVLVTLKQSFEFSTRKGGSDLAKQEPKNQQLTEWVTVPADEAKAVYFWIVPDTLGQIKIEIVAQAPSAADALRRTLLVEPEGVEKEYTNSYFINNVETNSYTRDLAITFPQNTVVGSERVSVTAVGDMLSQSMSSLERLIRMPYGCGEQNMVAFVPNIVALKYLQATGQDNKELQKKAIHYMETGYQKELSYKHSDGSYSAFGERDRSGSLWLTAFVLKSFLQAKEFIYIDNNAVTQAARWMIRHQHRRNDSDEGMFNEPGVVLSPYMQGGSAKGAALTAYSLIALSQNNFTMEGEEKQLMEAKQMAMEYLENRVLGLQDKPYTLAIATYALHLAGSKSKDQAFNLLKSRAVEKASEGMRYWETQIGSGSNTKHYWYSHAQASDVELNAYALLIYLHRGLVDESLPVAKWLLAQRNANGGFRSTQDTVIGLEALGELAAKMGRAKQQNIQLTVRSPQVSHTFEPITKDNKLVLQRAEFPGKVTNITVESVGLGLAILQVAVHYNVEEDDLKPAVLMTVETSSMKDYLHLNICSSWAAGGDSGMMVTEIQMLTGYSQEETNAEILERLKDKGVKRVENKDKNLVFYFEELTTEPTCIDLRMKKTQSVNKIKKARIATYQYYSPDKQTIVMYSPSKEDANQDPCSVCPACCKADQDATQSPVEPN